MLLDFVEWRFYIQKAAEDIQWTSNTMCFPVSTISSAGFSEIYDSQNRPVAIFQENPKYKTRFTELNIISLFHYCCIILYYNFYFTESAGFKNLPHKIAPTSDDFKKHVHLLSILDSHVFCTQNRVCSVLFNPFYHFQIQNSRDFPQESVW